FKHAILSTLTIERQGHAYLMPTSTQRTRQRIHHVYQRARSLQWRTLRAAHQNSHSAFAGGCFLILFARQISFFDPLKRFISRAQASLQLSGLDCLEDLAKLRAGLKTERD